MKPVASLASAALYLCTADVAASPKIILCLRLRTTVADSSVCLKPVSSLISGSLCTEDFVASPRICLRGADRPRDWQPISRKSEICDLSRFCCTVPVQLRDWQPASKRREPCSLAGLCSTVVSCALGWASNKRSEVCSLADFCSTVPVHRRRRCLNKNYLVFGAEHLNGW